MRNQTDFCEIYTVIIRKCIILHMRSILHIIEFGYSGWRILYEVYQEKYQWYVCYIYTLYNSYSLLINSKVIHEKKTMHWIVVLHLFLVLKSGMVTILVSFISPFSKMTMLHFPRWRCFKKVFQIVNQNLASFRAHNS